MIPAGPTPALSGVHSSPPARLPVGGAFALDCPACSTSGPAHTTSATVEALIQIHDRMHHKRMNPEGAAFARVVAISAICESCQLAPSTRTLPDPLPGGTPFALCDGCALTDTGGRLPHAPEDGAHHHPTQAHGGTPS